jgi:hypothetical protein
MEAENPFEGAPIISRYTREQAIEDGFLVDLSEATGTEIYKYPVAFTRELWTLVEAGAGKDPDVRAARIWDVCYMSAKFHKAITPERVAFKVKIGRQTPLLWAECGPADDGSPCVTIGYPEDF